MVDVGYDRELCALARIASARGNVVALCRSVVEGDSYASRCAFVTSCDVAVFSRRFYERRDLLRGAYIVGNAQRYLLVTSISRSVGRQIYKQ